jgi:hypothetical protein
MGFQRSTLKLVFDGDFEGFEVSSRRLSVNDVFDLASLRGVKPTEEDMREKFRALAELLVGILVSWNLEDANEQPVPLVADEVAKLDYQLVLHIAGTLAEAAVGVSRPLSQPSSDSDTSVEESIPMEPLSESPPS